MLRLLHFSFNGDIHWGFFLLQTSKSLIFITGTCGQDPMLLPLFYYYFFLRCCSPPSVRVKLNFAPKNSRTFYPELSRFTVSSIFQTRKKTQHRKLKKCATLHHPRTRSEPRCLRRISSPCFS